MNPVFPWNWSFRQFLCQSTYFPPQKSVKPHVIVQWKKQDLISILWLRAKKLNLWFHKRETHVPLSQMDTQISNFLFLSSFLTKLSILFALICWNFCNDFNSKYSFLPYIVPFLRTRLKPGRVSERFHWNWSEFHETGRFSLKLSTKKGTFFCAFLA